MNNEKAAAVGNNSGAKGPKDGAGMSETQTVLLVVGEEKESCMSSTWRGGNGRVMQNQKTEFLYPSNSWASARAD